MKPSDFTVGGHYNLCAISPDGSRRPLGEFDNLITNTALDWIGKPPPFGSGVYYQSCLMGLCYLGTGVTAPAYTDTKMTVFGTANSTTGSNTYTSTYVAGSPSIWQYVMTYTFAAGVATGTWSEIGVGPAASGGAITLEPSPPYLLSHALIVDGGGSPTTISVLASEQLVVTYTLQLYFSNVQTAYTPFMINTTSTSGSIMPGRISQINTTFPTAGAGNGLLLYLATGTFGAITGYPTGTLSPQVSGTSASYTTGNYYLTINTTTPVNSNFVNTWSMIYVESSAGHFQMSVSPSVVIGAGMSFTFQYNVSWSRH